MATYQFPKDLYIQTLETGAEGYIGSYTPSTGMEIQYGLLHIFKKGTPGGTEQLRLRVYSDPTFQSNLFNSDWLSVSDITDGFGTSSDWIGSIRFDFARQNMAANRTYYVRIESSNYTRNGEIYYIGFTYDWPETVNTQTGSTAGAKLELYGYE